MDAKEYTIWLNKTHRNDLPPGYIFRLPSEAEWEKAARGTDGRIYPWGIFFDKNKCNTEESEIGFTTPVGVYSPQGDSPFGVSDMAGNVWEWTSSKIKRYPFRFDDRREVDDVKETSHIVIRGGACDYGKIEARTYTRFGGSPIDAPFHYIGFRLVVSFHLYPHKIR